MSDIGVVYIARGADPNWCTRFVRFALSYKEHPAGIDHQLYIIFKEFENEDNLVLARKLFSRLNPVEILDYIEFNSYGGGCFQEACNHVKEPLLCTLVSTTEIMHDDWLAKLYAAFTNSPNIGLVGCTGSKEATLHIRDTAILIDREFYQSVVGQFDFKTSKLGYLDFEHGPTNLTSQVLASGKAVLVVEKDRVLSPHEWGHTTYRGNLENVLVHDRGARDFKDL
jgi:hypothetical protein